jgi:hypothetical protein
MRTGSKPDHENQPLTLTVRWIESKARRFFSADTRSHIRQNALRGAIASLIETERMRLALTIAHRHDG